LLTDNTSDEMEGTEPAPDSEIMRFCIYFGRAMRAGAPDVMSAWRNSIAQTADDPAPAADASSPQDAAPPVPLPASPDLPRVPPGKSAKALLLPPAKALRPPLPPSKANIPSALVPSPGKIPAKAPTPDAIPASARVTVSLWTEEQSPRAFTDELNRVRTNWLVDQFTQNAKLRRDRITIRYLSARTGKALSCGEEMSATDSVAYIEISTGH
jgi:hypothetical protein